MSVALLGTKLFVPRPARNNVARQRLLDRLAPATQARVCLVSAPPGFGKTALLAEWVGVLTTAPSPASVGWVSLDAADNDPATFWSYLVAAVQQALPSVGAGAAAMLGDGPAPAVNAALTMLLNELSTVDTQVVLVLDDYHVIGDAAIHSGLGFLVEHAPPQLHLVIASRADPPLPLPRLRARGELVEVRAADLRFTRDEAASYLNDAMGLTLPDAEVSSLGSRTEGWIAALQLAALSLADRSDTSDFIAGFAGDDRFVVDYLAEEVMRRQDPDVQAFLLDTSILQRMTAALCDATTGRLDARAMLERLERDNLFVVPLDDQRRWFRYHHLFADVLRARLQDERPDDLAGLHRRASAWLARHDDRDAAVHHALAGHDVETAADLIELEMPALRRDRRETTLRAWLEDLPEQVVLRRPALCNGLAGARLSVGVVDGVAEWLDAAERLLTMVDDGAGDPPADPSRAPVVVDPEEHRRLPAYVAVHRAGLSLITGHPDATHRHAERARALAARDDHLMQGAAAALAGLAAWSLGDLEPAETSYAASVHAFEAIGHLSDVFGCARALADIQVARGRLRAATDTLEKAVALGARHQGPTLRGSTDLHVGLADLAIERDDLTTAHRELGIARDLGTHAGLPQTPYRLRVASALVGEAEGDVDAALGLLEEAAGLYNGDYSPETRPVLAQRARMALRHGRTDLALTYVDQRGLSVEDPVEFLREYDLVTLASTLTATSRPGEAGALDAVLALLASLRAAAARRPGSLIDIGLAEAATHQRRGDVPAAASSLHDVLELAESTGHRRTLLVETDLLGSLLDLVEDEHGTSGYVVSLRASLRGGADVSAPPVARQAGLVDPLSARELDILRLLATQLRGPEIADHLVVSLNTVRTHTRNVYTKLGVNSRMAAVHRARELGLI